MRNLRCEGACPGNDGAILAKPPTSDTKRDNLPHNARTSGTANGQKPLGTGRRKAKRGTGYQYQLCNGRP